MQIGLNMRLRPTISSSVSERGGSIGLIGLLVYLAPLPATRSAPAWFARTCPFAADRRARAAASPKRPFRRKFLGRWFRTHLLLFHIALAHGHRVSAPCVLRSAATAGRVS